MKTKNAFALRGFDVTRILQRRFFRDLNLPVGDDEKILEDYFANISDIHEVAQKVNYIEQLNNLAKKYLFHLEAHGERRLKRIMQIYADKYISSNDETIKKKYQRVLDLRASYHDLYWSVLNPFYNEVVSGLVVTGNLTFIKRCRDSFGTRLRQARKAAGLTQTELAERVGLKTYSAITQYERGINDPSLPTLLRLSTTLNCSVDWLLGLK